MNNRLKNSIYSLVLILLLGAGYYYRKNAASNYTHLQGKTMGTTYQVKFKNIKNIDIQSGIDSVLEQVNMSMSTYIPTSEISLFNLNDTLQNISKDLEVVYLISKDIYSKTEGAFDPTIMPLVNAWGFGPKKRDSLPENQVDSLKKLLGFDEILVSEQSLIKKRSNIQLDFSAVAKGYGVDKVAKYLELYDINDYMVEIGGEVRCKGLNDKNESFKMGIQNPLFFEAGGEQAHAVISLKNRSMATSGNYLNFYERGGKKYAHTIDPLSGYPVQHSLISASIIANDCATADALATACMVAGIEKAMKWVEKDPTLDCILIFQDQNGSMNTYISPSIKDDIVILQ